MSDDLTDQGDGGLLRLEVGAVAHGGSCVARHEGRVVFVRHALPGEEVLVRVERAGPDDRFWRGDAVEVLRASPDRVDPRCPHSGPGGCGGCDWQHVSLPAQRRAKSDVVREQLQRLAGVDLAELLPDFDVEAVPVDPDGRDGPVGPVGPDGPDGSDGSDGDGLGWRTRMRFALDPVGRPGLRKHRSHDVVPIQVCPIAHSRLNAVGVGAKRWRDVAAVEVVVPGLSGEAAGLGAQDPLVVVEPVDAPVHGPARRVDVPALGIPVSSAVRGPAGLQRLRGRTWVEESVLVDGERRRFRVTGTGFWQVHPAAAQTLLDAVLEATRPLPGERAFDLYCGVGLFAAALALRVGPHGSVLGVEGDERGCADARRNLHDLPQVSLAQGRVDRVLSGLAGSGGGQDAADVVVLDPPRAGAGRQVMDAVCALDPRVIAYVACDPASLARDVAIAADNGYRLAGLRAFDLFPMTHHMECVATLVPLTARPAGQDPVAAVAAVEEVS